MENRFQHFLLTAVLGATLTVGTMPSFGAATPASNDKTNQTQEKSGDDPESDDQDSESQQAELPRISPVIERIPFDPAQIDTEDFEIILFAGLMSVEDFGANPVFGGRFAYHASEDFFLEAQYGQTTTDPTSAETLSSLQLLTDDQRDLSYYTMSLGYNVLPSEAYLGRKFAFRSALYVLAGAGSTSFAGENHFTVSFGAGYRFLINDWIAVHLTMQDNMFDSELSGEKKTTQNLQFQLGLSGFF